MKPQEKGDFLIVALDERGHVAEVELRTWEESGGLFKIQKDNQNSFPTYKLDAPLWHVPAGHQGRVQLKRKDLTGEERCEILRSLCAATEPSMPEADRRRLKARMQEFARKLQPSFLEHWIDAPAACLLIERLLREDLDVAHRTCEIRDGVLAEIGAGHETRKRIGESCLLAL